MSSPRRLPDPRERPWLTVAELAMVTGEGEKAIRAALAAGHLPQLRIGRYVRIPTAALLTALGMPQNTSEPGPPEPGIATTSTPPPPGSEINSHAAGQRAPQSNNVRSLTGL